VSIFYYFRRWLFLEKSSEIYNRIGFLLIAILGGAFIGAMLALIAWVFVKKLISRGWFCCLTRLTIRNHTSINLIRD
jgi:hypothetical protein